MHKPLPKLIPILTASLCVLAGCASADTTESLKASFDSGVAAYDAGDYPKAFQIWSSLTDEDVAAMRNVAMMERKGQGTAKDPKAAEDMFSRAAEAGLPTAQADLADMLLKGEAGPPDPQAALPLLEAAAAANHPIAQFELGQMYETGQIVPRDLNVARNLYAASASHGMKEAQDRLTALGPPTPDSSAGAAAGTPGSVPVLPADPAPKP
jgi:TPR repeat protein